MAGVQLGPGAQMQRLKSMLVALWEPKNPADLLPAALVIVKIKQKAESQQIIFPMALKSGFCGDLWAYVYLLRKPFSWLALHTCISSTRETEARALDFEISLCFIERSSPKSKKEETLATNSLKKAIWQGEKIAQVTKCSSRKHQDLRSGPRSVEKGKRGGTYL